MLGYTISKDSSYEGLVNERVQSFVEVLSELPVLDRPTAVRKVLSSVKPGAKKDLLVALAIVGAKDVAKVPARVGRGLYGMYCGFSRSIFAGIAGAAHKPETFDKNHMPLIEAIDELAKEFLDEKDRLEVMIKVNEDLAKSNATRLDALEQVAAKFDALDARTSAIEKDVAEIKKSVSGLRGKSRR